MTSPQAGTWKHSKRIGPSWFLILLSVASAVVLARDAGAADLPIQQPITAHPLAPAQPAATKCFASLYDFLMAGPEDCPLTWNGITLYGRLDWGIGYESHGVPLALSHLAFLLISTYAQGEARLSKFNRLANRV
jgi:hypothetical protein